MSKNVFLTLPLPLGRDSLFLPVERLSTENRELITENYPHFTSRFDFEMKRGAFSLMSDVENSVLSVSVFSMANIPIANAITLILMLTAVEDIYWYRELGCCPSHSMYLNL